MSFFHARVSLHRQRCIYLERRGRTMGTAAQRRRTVTALRWALHRRDRSLWQRLCGWLWRTVPANAAEYRWAERIVATVGSARCADRGVSERLRDDRKSDRQCRASVIKDLERARKALPGLPRWVWKLMMGRKIASLEAELRLYSASRRPGG